MDLTIFDQICYQFETIATGGVPQVRALVMSTFWILATIDACMAFLTNLEDGDHIKILIQKCLKIGFWLFFVNSWGLFCNVIKNSLIMAGGVIGSGGSLSLMQHPSQIVSQGILTLDPILEYESTFTGITEVMANFAMVIACIIAYLFGCLAYVLLGIQVVLTYVEFYLMCALFTVFVPFGVTKWTSFLAEKAIGGVIAYGVKLMVLSCIVSIVLDILNAYGNGFTLTPDNALTAMISLVAVGVLLAFFAWAAPALAASMMTGGPSLTAGSVAATGAGVAAGAAVLAVGGAAAAGAIGKSGAAGAASSSGVAGKGSTSAAANALHGAGPSGGGGSSSGDSGGSSSGGGASPSFSGGGASSYGGSSSSGSSASNLSGGASGSSSGGSTGGSGGASASSGSGSSSGSNQGKSAGSSVSSAAAGAAGGVAGGKAGAAIGGAAAGSAGAATGGVAGSVVGDAAGSQAANYAAGDSSGSATTSDSGGSSSGADAATSDAGSSGSGSNVASGSSGGSSSGRAANNSDGQPQQQKPKFSSMARDAMMIKNMTPQEPGPHGSFGASIRSD